MHDTCMQVKHGFRLRPCDSSVYPPTARCRSIHHIPHRRKHHTQSSARHTAAGCSAQRTRVLTNTSVALAVAVPGLLLLLWLCGRVHVEHPL
jgi:hypothetical protein